MVSSLPAVPFGGIHYRLLERDKIEALELAQGNFDAPMAISETAIFEIDWWLRNLDHSLCYISMNPPEITLFSGCITIRLGGYSG